MNNYHMIKAKKEKNDEFYTQISDIEKELSNYPADTFKNKIIYCPCDVGVDGLDVPKSNFVKYFEMNKERFGYKQLLHTSLQEGYDFHSTYCTNLLKEADIVVTNPPFSLFRDFFKWLMDNNKKFIIVGNRASMTTDVLFPNIVNNKLWTGYSTTHHVFFEVPDWYAEQLKADPTRKEGHGNSYKIVGDKVLAEVNACWYTNVDITKRHKPLLLIEKYSPENYPKYDNYDAIDVSKTDKIPCDYNGLMGVPMTFLEKYNPDQFEIIGKLSPVLNNKNLYARVIIRRKEVVK